VQIKPKPRRRKGIIDAGIIGIKNRKPQRKSNTIHAGSLK
jgi:hypothetical protein